MVVPTKAMASSCRPERLLPDVQGPEPELHGGAEPGGVLPHLRRGRTAVECEYYGVLSFARGSSGAAVVMQANPQFDFGSRY